MNQDMQPKPGETLDTIKDVRLFQAKNGYRFSVDALLLEHFISAKPRQKGMELGAGSCIISILLAGRIRDVKLYAAEIQKALAERAERNVALNGLAGKIDVLHADIKNLRHMFAANEFDFVFSNPPFRKPRTGRMSIHGERAVARHEIEITLPDLVETASYLLKHSGKFCLIYHPFRLVELISLLRGYRLEPKKMKFVHSRKDEEARMVLIEAVKGSGAWLKIEPPLYIHDETGNYTSEMKNIVKP